MDNYYIDPELLSDALDDLRDETSVGLLDAEDVALAQSSLENLFGEDDLAF